MTAASSTKVLIVAALTAETKPLLRHFQLQKDPTFKRLEVFSNRETFLITTGVGKVRSAVAVASFFAAVDDVESFIALNIGIAGAAAGNGFEIGTPLLAHKIIDQGTGRAYFPDLLVNTSLKETVLTTVERPHSMTCDEAPIAGAVDMEGSGFFQAATTFLSPHRIGCIKIISDHLDGAAVTKESVSTWMTAAMPALDLATAAYRASGLLTPPRMQPEDTAWLLSTAERLRLTVTQQHQLTGWAASYRARHSESLPDFSAAPLTAPQNKQERTRQLAALKHLLSA